jgi:hypothetical protein
VQLPLLGECTRTLNQPVCRVCNSLPRTLPITTTRRSLQRNHHARLGLSTSQVKTMPIMRIIHW